MKKNTRLIVALDETDRERALKIAEELSDIADAIKINWPLVLHSSPSIISEISELCDVICDFKVADIPNTVRLIVEKAVDLGASGIIVHGFVGHDSVREAVQSAGESADIFVVTEMSHPGGKEFTAPVAERLAALAVDCGASGVIAPATRLDRIKTIRRIVGDLLILAPGVGAQGGSAGDAISMGADYVIVGRSIYKSSKPRDAAEAICDEIASRLGNDRSRASDKISR
ncbi:MAG: orotidine-5'-phosphate decarboxylase [Methanomassiliicoccales archaeon]|jgi:orotidine-5'-phosphate decarboxylase|nr:orotidine-5'-phosphate decarboxylase [Methanomassiliicoccales archaeon]